MQREIAAVRAANPDFEKWFKELEVAGNEIKRRFQNCEEGDQECRENAKEFAQAEWDVLKAQLQSLEGGDAVLAAVQAAVKSCSAEPQPESKKFSLFAIDAEQAQCINVSFPVDQ